MFKVKQFIPNEHKVRAFYWSDEDHTVYSEPVYGFLLKVEPPIDEGDLEGWVIEPIVMTDYCWFDTEGTKRDDRDMNYLGLLPLEVYGPYLEGPETGTEAQTFL